MARSDRDWLKASRAHAREVEEVVPRRKLERRCEHCHGPMPRQRDGRSANARFCKDACRAAWHRDAAKRELERLRLELARRRGGAA